MEFTIQKSKLTGCLNMVRIAIPPKTTNPILKNVLLKIENGKATFRATNTILDISVTIPVNMKTEGSCCFDGMFLDVIQNFSDDEIKFKLSEKLIVSQGRRKHHPLFSDIDEYPQKQEIDNYVEYDPVEFLAALSKTSICTSTLVDRPILQGFYINPHENYIVASDGDRVGIWENIELPGEITIPHSKIVMSVLSMMEADKFEISLGRWTGFRGTSKDMSWEIIFNSLAGEFPETARKAVNDALNDKPKLLVIVNKREIKNKLEICNIYSIRAHAEGRPDQVILSKNGQGLIFSMMIPDLIEMEEHLEAETEGDDFEIWLNPRMLIEAISQIQSDEVELRFFDTRFILLDKEVPQFAYLQAAMVSADKE